MALIAYIPKSQIKARLAGSCNDWGYCSGRQSVDSPSTNFSRVRYSVMVIRCTVKTPKQSICKLITALFIANV